MKELTGIKLKNSFKLLLVADGARTQNWAFIFSSSSATTVVLWVFSVFGKMHMYRDKIWEEKHRKQFCSYDRANNNWRRGCGALNTFLPFVTSHMDLFSTFSCFSLCCVSFHFSSYFYRANFKILSSLCKRNYSLDASSAMEVW